MCHDRMATGVSLGHQVVIGDLKKGADCGRFVVLTRCPVADRS